MQTENNFMRLREVQNKVSYSAPQIWRLEKAGKFPKRIRIGENRVAWLESEVNGWVDDKIRRSRTQMVGEA